MINASTWARVLLVGLFLTAFPALPSQANGLLESKRPKRWRAVHVLDYNSDADLEALS